MVKVTYLAHHGIKGQKWGVRRYQNTDGSLTPEGKMKYGTLENMEATRSRNKKIAIGVGITTATAAVFTGGVLLAKKNKKLNDEIKSYKGITEELNTYKLKEKQRLDNLSKGREKRAYNIANGIKPVKKVKIPAGAKVEVTPKDRETTKVFLDVLGGFVNPKGGK